MSSAITPVYSYAFVESIREAAEVLASQQGLDTSEICDQIPHCLPKGCRECSYVIDLSDVSEEQVQPNNDGYGFWGAGKTVSELVSRIKGVVQLVSHRGRLQSCYKDYDWRLLRYSFSHPSVPLSQFQKHFFLITRNGESSPTLALVSYRWVCEPFNLTRTSLTGEAEEGTSKEQQAPEPNANIPLPPENVMVTTEGVTHAEETNPDNDDAAAAAATAIAVSRLEEYDEGDVVVEQLVEEDHILSSQSSFYEEGVLDEAAEANKEKVEMPQDLEQEQVFFEQTEEQRSAGFENDYSGTVSAEQRMKFRYAREFIPGAVPQLPGSTHRRRPPRATRVMLPTYSRSFVSNIPEAAAVFLSDIDPMKICNGVPQFMPAGAREASYIIDLKCLKKPIVECGQDGYAGWGQARGEWEVVALIDGQAVVVSRKGRFKPGFSDYDCKITRCVYTHPLVPAGHFVKRVFKMTLRDEIEPSLALLSYKWYCDPFALGRKHRIKPEFDDGQEYYYYGDEDSMLVLYEEECGGRVVEFSSSFVNTIEDAAAVFLSDMDTSVVCTAVPKGMADGQKEASYLIDLAAVPTPRRQCTVDRYGRWGPARGDWEVVALVDDQVKVVSRKGLFKPGYDDYDCKINRCVYAHPNVSSGQFIKRVFKVTRRDETEPALALISYKWFCEPFDVVVGNSVTRSPPDTTSNPSRKRTSEMLSVVPLDLDELVKKRDTRTKKSYRNESSEVRHGKAGDGGSSSNS